MKRQRERERVGKRETKRKTISLKKGNYYWLYFDPHGKFEANLTKESKIKGIEGKRKIT